MVNVIIRIIEMLLRKFKLVFFYMLTVGVLVSALMLMVPKTFNSNAMIQPVTVGESTGILGVLSGLTGGGSASQSESGLLLSILESRSILESIVDEFNLMEVYEAEIREELVQGLREDYEVTVTDQGAIHLSFATHTDWISNKEDELRVRTRAQEILKHVISYLDQRNVSLKTQSSRFQREFLENRFNDALLTLDSLETVFKEFEQTTSIVALEAQLEGKIQIATDLKRELVEVETEIYVARRSLSADSPKLIELQLIRASLLDQIKKFESSDPGSDTYGLDQAFPPFNSIPELSVRYKHIEMQMEAHFKIIEFLGTQLEEAKLGEARDTPTIQIIDTPTLPEIRSAPQRAITVLVTAFIAFIMITFLLYMYENLGVASKESAYNESLQTLKATFLSIFSRDR